MDASLAEPEPDADLQKLCEQLADLPLLCNQFTGGAAVDCFVVGVTSGPDHRQLKSRLAARLAWLLAQSERARILLLELDLNHPSVDGVMQLAMPPGAGFSQQVQAQLHEDGPAPWTVVRCTPHLSVLAEGRLRTPSVAYFPQFPAALASLRRHYDVIVAAGPAIGNSTDASGISDLVDGIVFAVPIGLSDPKAVATASQWFSKPVLAIANQQAPNPR
jgi:Mrp family chromosome partitioning ATPase